MKIPNPELTKGDAEEMDFLILKTKSWNNSLCYVFHLAIGKMAWIESELNDLLVFPALVIDLAFEKKVSVESQSPQQEKATKENSTIILIPDGREADEERSMLDLVPTNQEVLMENVKLKGSLGCSDHGMEDPKTLSAVRRVHSNLTSGEKTVASSESYLLEYHGIKPWKEEGPRKMVNIQGSPALSPGVSSPTKRKAKITESLCG
ncbi:hypothetical protein DUI87_07301 [Hirundo rustica rustica]|uniref:Uncharacterized protein n=1 Tax=Hirundo rustica rustica TaxID=333673 RepID=A0A3M0KWG7_HIRRU|nr:hypothetical protein DUI87_07301 [Hirundo rustica rustica]